MGGFQVSVIAGRRLDEIFVYTRDRWGDEQAGAYIHGLFACFDRIARRDLLWRAIPADFGIEGFYCRHELHFVYWRILSDGSVGIVTILHKRMHQLDRFRSDAEP